MCACVCAHVHVGGACVCARTCVEAAYKTEAYNVEYSKMILKVLPLYLQ